jgi:hypothetical protein
MSRGLDRCRCVHRCQSLVPTHRPWAELGGGRVWLLLSVTWLRVTSTSLSQGRRSEEGGAPECSWVHCQPYGRVSSLGTQLSFALLAVLRLSLWVGSGGLLQPNPLLWKGPFIKPSYDDSHGRCQVIPTDPLTHTQLQLRSVTISNQGIMCVPPWSMLRPLGTILP